MPKKIEIFDSFEQRSEEWYAIRRGIATASQFKRVIGGRGGDVTYMSELIAQVLTEKTNDHYVGDSMEHGIDTENQGLANYEFINDVDVRRVAFIKASEFIGCSPDGLIGEEGLVEIKCPDTHTHIKWTIANVVPKDHWYQVIGTLLVTGREWVDFISFDPRLDKKNDMFIVRTYTKDIKDDIESLKSKLDIFVATMAAHLKRFKGDN